MYVNYNKKKCVLHSQNFQKQTPKNFQTRRLTSDTPVLDPPMYVHVCILESNGNHPREHKKTPLFQTALTLVEKNERIFWKVITYRSIQIVWFRKIMTCTCEFIIMWTFDVFGCWVIQVLILKSRSFFVQVLCVVLSILTCILVTLTSTRGYHCQSEVTAPREYYIGAGALIFVFVSEAV